MVFGKIIDMFSRSWFDISIYRVKRVKRFYVKLFLVLFILFLEGSIITIYVCGFSILVYNIIWFIPSMLSMFFIIYMINYLDMVLYLRNTGCIFMVKKENDKNGES